MRNESESEIAYALREGLRQVARSITPFGKPGQDANGGYVDSLTESCMGITGGLVRVAEAINNLAEAIEGKSNEGEDVSTHL